MSVNLWKNPSGNEFSDYYKIMARGFQRDGQSGVDGVVAEGMRRFNAGLPQDKSIAEALAQGYEKIRGDNYNEARAIYQHVLTRDPNNPEALSNLGICAAVTGSPMVGLKLMTQAVQTLPNAPTYHNNLGELLRMMGRFTEAEGAFRNSLRLNPRDPGIHSVLGLTLAQQGRLAEGLDAARRGMEMKPDLPAAHYRLGLILLLMRQPADARAAFERALSLDPAFAPAREELQKLNPPQKT
jgi:Flp pilus assembly protein TadD